MWRQEVLLRADKKLSDGVLVLSNLGKIFGRWFFGGVTIFFREVKNTVCCSHKYNFSIGYFCKFEQGKSLKVHFQLEIFSHMKILYRMSTILHFPAKKIYPWKSSFQIDTWKYVTDKCRDLLYLHIGNWNLLCSNRYSCTSSDILR